MNFQLLSTGQGDRRGVRSHVGLTEQDLGLL